MDKVSDKSYEEFWPTLMDLEMREYIELNIFRLFPRLDTELACFVAFLKAERDGVHQTVASLRRQARTPSAVLDRLEAAEERLDYLSKNLGWAG